MKHLKLLLTPFTCQGATTQTVVCVGLGNLAYFFGLMFGTLSILQHFGIV